MTINTDSNQTASETALRIAELIRTSQELKAAGQDMSVVDQQIKPYKTMYVRAGAVYGGTSAGMLRWFDERAEGAKGLEQHRASDFVYELNHDGLRRVVNVSPPLHVEE